MGALMISTEHIWKSGFIKDAHKIPMATCIWA